MSGPLAGFKFLLLQGSSQIGVTATSAADGTFSFGTLNVAPGSYTVKEGIPASLGKWVATDPASAERTITVNLGDTDATVPPFGNTPLSDIGVTFTSDTTPAATTSAISCFQVSGDGTTATVGAGSAGAYTAANLRVGTYSCTVVVTEAPEAK